MSEPVNISKARPIKPMAMSFQRLIEVAREKEFNPVFYAALIQSDHITNKEIWANPTQPTIESARTTVNLYLTDEKDFITKLAMEISKSIKFPIATAHLHSLGVIAAAMTKSFNFEYNGKTKPCNLYVVTGQPPSTGKSGVNEILFEPVEEAFDTLNKSSAITRKRLQIQLAQAEKAVDAINKSKGSTSDDELHMALTLVDDIQARLNHMPEWIVALDDTTIEAAEALAGMQNGMFNIVSAEAEALEVILGGVYTGDDKAKGNFGLVLKAWDGERIAVHRITRDGYKGKVRASIAVIAQNSNIESLMERGAKGRGLPERFLMLNEPNLLGTRDHNQRRPIDRQVLSDYKVMITNIVNEPKCILKFKPEYTKLINDFRNKQESKIADGGEYDSSMLTGFVGKADKHILKLACIYHAVDEWGIKGTKNKEVSQKSVIRAITVFEQLMVEYAQSAADLGFAGKLVQLQSICKYFDNQVRKNRRSKVTFTEFYDSIRNVSSFKGARNITTKLKKELIPILEQCNYLILQNDTIYINPRLK
jgi:hypothetical protein